MPVPLPVPGSRREAPRVPPAPFDPDPYPVPGSPRGGPPPAGGPPLGFFDRLLALGNDGWQRSLPDPSFPLAAIRDERPAPDLAVRHDPRPAAVPAPDLPPDPPFVPGPQHLERPIAEPANDADPLRQRPNRLGHPSPLRSASRNRLTLRVDPRRRLFVRSRPRFPTRPRFRVLKVWLLAVKAWHPREVTWPNSCPCCTLHNLNDDRPPRGKNLLGPPGWRRTGWVWIRRIRKGATRLCGEAPVATKLTDLRPSATGSPLPDCRSRRVRPPPLPASPLRFSDHSGETMVVPASRLLRAPRAGGPLRASRPVPTCYFVNTDTFPPPRVRGFVGVPSWRQILSLLSRIVIAYLSASRGFSRSPSTMSTAQV